MTILHLYIRLKFITLILTYCSRCETFVSSLPMCCSSAWWNSHMEWVQIYLFKNFMGKSLLLKCFEVRLPDSMPFQVKKNMLSHTTIKTFVTDVIKTFSRTYAQ